MLFRSNTGDPTEAHALRLSKSKAVHIINPVHGCGWTNERKARQYVARGMAEWVGSRIRFLPGDHRVISAAARARDRLVDGGMATLNQVRGVPVIQPVVLLTIHRKRKRAEIHPQ